MDHTKIKQHVQKRFNAVGLRNEVLKVDHKMRTPSLGTLVVNVVTDLGEPVQYEYALDRPFAMLQAIRGNVKYYDVKLAARAQIGYDAEHLIFPEQYTDAE